MKNKIIASAAMLPMIVTGLSALAAHVDDITVVNTNYAEVGSEVVVSANTGWNSSMGGNGGDAGMGGSVKYSDSENMGGMGGNAGNGGMGGTVDTGDATAYASVVNDINYNDTDIETCGCEEEGHEHEEDGWWWKKNHGSDVLVDNWNSAGVGTGAVVLADTGLNSTTGGDAGMGGNGGKVKNSNDENTGGDGGSAGNGGNGGKVTTGMSDAGAALVNIVNTNITRIRR